MNLVERFWNVQLRSSPIFFSRRKLDRWRSTTTSETDWKNVSVREQEEEFFFSFWEKFRKIGGADKPGEIVRLVASLLPPYKRYVLCLVLSLSLSLALTHTLSLSLTLSSAIVHLRTRTNARAHALTLSHMLRKLEENSSHPEFLLPDLRSHFIFRFFLSGLKTLQPQHRWIPSSLGKISVSRKQW